MLVCNYNGVMELSINDLLLYMNYVACRDKSQTEFVEKKLLHQ